MLIMQVVSALKSYKLLFHVLIAAWQTTPNFSALKKQQQQKPILFTFHYFGVRNLGRVQLNDSFISHDIIWDHPVIYCW